MGSQEQEGRGVKSQHSIRLKAVGFFSKAFEGDAGLIASSLP